MLSTMPEPALSSGHAMRTCQGQDSVTVRRTEDRISALPKPGTDAGLSCMDPLHSAG